MRQEERSSFLQKRSKKLLFAVVCAGLGAGLLGGCAGTSGVIPVGPDTYTLTEMRAPAVGGGVAARAAVLSEGDAFCRSLGRRFVLQEAKPDGDPYTPFWPTAFDAVFACR